MERRNECSGGDATAEDLVVGELFVGQPPLCFGVADLWVQLTPRACASVIVECMNRVHLAAELDLKFDFLYFLF